jgi:hypothetical protein
MVSLSSQKLQMNDTYTDICNSMFDLIIKRIEHNNKLLTHRPPPSHKESLLVFIPTGALHDFFLLYTLGDVLSLSVLNL